MGSLSVRPHQTERLSEILDFIRANPWKPTWSDDLARRFLTELTSSTELVFDIHDGNTRVAVAVLLDKIQNKGNHANLEVLGLHPSANPTQVFEEILSLATKRSPKNKDGFEISFHHSFEVGPWLVKKYGLVLYYQTFEMRNDSFHSLKPPQDDFVTASPTDDSELYQVLVEAFRDNVDTSIPAFTDWKAARHRHAGTVTWLKRQDNKIAGFLNLIMDSNRKSAEIRTVGVLPSFRGHGLGRSLITHALCFLNSQKIPTCQLTVAVQNRSALNLYRQLGFKEMDHYFVFATSLAGHI